MVSALATCVLVESKGETFQVRFHRESGDWTVDTVGCDFVILTDKHFEVGRRYVVTFVKEE